MTAKYSTNLDPQHEVQDSRCSSSLDPCSPHGTLLVLSTTGFNPLKSINKDNTALFSSAFNNQRSKSPAFLFVTHLTLQSEGFQQPNPRSRQACNRRALSGKKPHPSHSLKGLTSSGSQPGALARDTEGAYVCFSQYHMQRKSLRDRFRAPALQSHCCGNSDGYSATPLPISSSELKKQVDLLVQVRA